MYEPCVLRAGNVQYNHGAGLYKNFFVESISRNEFVTAHALSHAFSFLVPQSTISQSGPHICWHNNVVYEGLVMQLYDSNFIQINRIL